MRRFWETFSSGDYTAAVNLLSDDATWWVAGSTALSGTYDKAAFAVLLGQVTGMLPQGIRVTPTTLTAEGERVAVEAESYGEVANGRTYRNLYHFLFECRDGRIAGVREYLDTEHVTATFAP